jgi:steroid delta-isomerase-like uncharacterized protein
MAELDSKKLVRSYFDKLCVQHDMAGASEFISEDYLLHDPMDPDFPGGREAFKKRGEGCGESIRDSSCTIEDQFAEGDRVATRWTVSGCQTKDMPGIPSKGKCFKMSGITISRVADGKIAEEWLSMDALGMQQQLGAD